MLKGKGYFIWKVEESAPDAAILAARAMQAGLGHVLIKIADGDGNYPLDDPDGSKERFTRDAIQALKSAGILVWGWTFVYGGKPEPEPQAKKFAARAAELGLNGFCVSSVNLPGRKWSAASARRFMETLVSEIKSLGIPEPTLALSSSASITSNPDFPFDAFMEFCQMSIPQVYWIAKDGGDPVRLLQDTYQQYSSRYPTKAMVPSGAAFGGDQTVAGEKFFWEARTDQITMFLNQAMAMSFPAVNFWSWQSAWEKRHLWDTIAAYPFQASVSTQPSPVSATATQTISLADTADDDGVAVINVGEPGYFEGVYDNTGGELVSFVREGNRCTWTNGDLTRSTAYAQWVPRITKSGEYMIEAWIPGINATTRRARYHVHGVVGQDSTVVVELSQINYSDEYARLGIFQLDGNHQFSGMVSLNNLVKGDTTANPQVAFGPVRWRRIERTGGVQPGFADGFDSPVGTEAERRTSKMPPGDWYDANPYLNLYELGYHTGSDFNLPHDKDRGAPAYAIADGTVTYSGQAFNLDGRPSGFGTLVVIRHDPYMTPDGQIINAYSRYGHMKDLVVSKGDRVRRGDKVGTIWNHGTRAHHLHFDISLTGILQTQEGHWPGSKRHEVEKHYVDPIQFIKKYRPPF
ncbi:MAG: M23 family metallopeptidase [Anaerolineae bacterium]|nr:M23 family metallopeptidase [Anaerolineae bacterium]